VAKFNPLLGDNNPNSGLPARKERTIHVRFRLIDCLFSDELSKVANKCDNVDRSALDSGEVDANSQYWKLVEDRFNSGFPAQSVDGPQFADKAHFVHPTMCKEPRESWKGCKHYHQQHKTHVVSHQESPSEMSHKKLYYLMFHLGTGLTGM